MFVIMKYIYFNLFKCVDRREEIYTYTQKKKRRENEKDVINSIIQIGLNDIFFCMHHFSYVSFAAATHLYNITIII